MPSCPWSETGPGAKSSRCASPSAKKCSGESGAWIDLPYGGSGSIQAFKSVFETL